MYVYFTFSNFSLASFKSWSPTIDSFSSVAIVFQVSSINSAKVFALVILALAFWEVTLGNSIPKFSVKSLWILPSARYFLKSKLIL